MIAADTEWIALFEDHNVAPAGWLAAADRAMAEAEPLTTALIGPLANLTSVSPWSWANFLDNFAPNWHPISGHAGPLIANLRVPSRSVAGLGATVRRVRDRAVAKVCRRARVVNDMWTDHVQHRSFITATSCQVHNARVVGALARMSVPSPWPPIADAIRLARERPALLSDIIAGHPRSAEPPPTRHCGCAGSPGLCASPTAGTCCFGPGRSDHHLE